MLPQQTKESTVATTWPLWRVGINGQCDFSRNKNYINVRISSIAFFLSVLILENLLAIVVKES